MLKNRSKTFAPKFKARRPTPASTPSSARPSVEPQSKTPALEGPAKEVTPTIIEEDASLLNTEHNAVPSVEPLPQTESSHLPRQIEDTTPQESSPEPSRSNLKRKTRDEDVPEPAPKRRPTPPVETTTPTSTDRNDSQSQNIHATPDALIDPQITYQNDTNALIDPQLTYQNDTNALIDPQLTNQGDPNTYVTSRAQPPTPAPTFLAPSSQVETFENDLQPDTANTIPSRSTSPESVPEPPRFRYPSPDGAQAMSTAVPGMGAAGGELPGLGAAGDTDSGAKTGQAAQVSQIVPMAGLNPDGSATAAVEEPASGTEKGKKKIIIRRKKVQAAEAGDDARATVDMQINRPRRTAGAKRARKKKDGEKKKRQRAVTPEGAEDEVIDQGMMTMGDLCRDVKTGKKFSRHDQIKQRIVDKKIQDREKKIEEMAGIASGEIPWYVDDDEPIAGSSRTARQEVEPVASSAGIQMRVVDGQLVMDDRTAMVDRHENGRDTGAEVQEIDEDEFSKLTTSGTYMRRVKAVQWDYAATELFYDGLRQFGTDFRMIAHMLKPRTRKMVKLKFKKEERNNPDQITKALTGEKAPINIEDWEKYAGKNLEEVEAIKAESAKIDEEHAAEDAEYEAELVGIQKQKKADIAANKSVPSRVMTDGEREKQKQKVDTAANRSAAARRVLASGGESDDDEPSGSRGTPAAGTDSAKENEPARSKSREASAAPKTRRRAGKDKGKKNINSANGGGEEFEVFEQVTAAPARQYVLDYNG